MRKAKQSGVARHRRKRVNESPRTPGRDVALVRQPKELKSLCIEREHNPHLTMTSKDGVSKERIDYEKPFSNCSN